ncbi:hypothetical protein HanIR_Chr01g0033151 [Helianthus annuus]|nr:hypothetical protein HanIR_Chr01g0033151 [Helianthus annuus]
MIVVVLLRSGGIDKIRVPRPFLSFGKAQTKLRYYIGPLKGFRSLGYGSHTLLDWVNSWVDWNKWHQNDVLSISHVDDFRITPMNMARVKDMLLIMRKLGSVEPDNYLYRVCEGETESVIQRPCMALDM